MSDLILGGAVCVYSKCTASSLAGDPAARALLGTGAGPHPTHTALCAPAHEPPQTLGTSLSATSCSPPSLRPAGVSEGPVCSCRLPPGPTGLFGQPASQPGLGSARRSQPAGLEFAPNPSCLALRGWGWGASEQLIMNLISGSRSLCPIWAFL